MPITTLSSREFNQRASYAKKAAGLGPVVITERGKPAHVLLSIAEYRRLTDRALTLAEALAEPGVEFDFDPPRIEIGLQVPDFS